MNFDYKAKKANNTLTLMAFSEKLCITANYFNRKIEIIDTDHVATFNNDQDIEVNIYKGEKQISYTSMRELYSIIHNFKKISVRSTNNDVTKTTSYHIRVVL